MKWKDMTTEKFITAVKDKYPEQDLDFSCTVFEDKDKYVQIRCLEKDKDGNEHGIFSVKPSWMLDKKAHGCPSCWEETKRLERQEKFKEEVRRRFPDADWDLSTVYYINNYTAVEIYCRKKDANGVEHGIFKVVPSDLLDNKCVYGCRKCYLENHKMSTTEFIARAIEQHGNKYGYDRANERDEDGKVWIYCPIHGYFQQRIAKHLSGQGCPYCGGRAKKTTEDFIKEAKATHPDDDYDYSLVEYDGIDKNVWIVCHKKDRNGNEHGSFQQTPYNHVNLGCGCPKCAVEGRTKSTEQFIADARKVHGDYYDYSRANYINNHTDVEIGCPVHGYFMQSPNAHLDGCGCKQCKESSLERKTRQILEDLGINYVYEKRFDWLGNQNVDFYLTEQHIGIECQGKQHYLPVDFANKGQEWANERFAEQLIWDQRKKQLCEENNLPLFYIRYDEDIEEAVNGIITQINANNGDNQRI